MSKKLARLTAVMEELTGLQTEMEADEAKNTGDNRERFKALHSEAMELKESIRFDTDILGIQTFLTEPVPGGINPVGGDGAFSQKFAQTLGDQFVESQGYKDALKADTLPNGMRVAMEAKGFLFGTKATFTSAAGGLDSTVNYVNPVGGPIVMLEQQRLTVRDLLSIGETTSASVPYIAEVSYTNGADMVAEEGEKPEATLATEDRSAPVRKIAVVLKVTDEMFADFPMLRDYINTRLRWMVVEKEEQQLLYGAGGSNEITGLMNASPQTVSATSPGEFNAIMTAKTKIRRASLGGGFEPDSIVINPEDWEGLRLTKDGTNGQYLGGGPFTGAYGNGPFIEEPRVWGLRPVITEAIVKGTALVGAFKLGAQIWQRSGIAVEATNSNEDDFNHNRVSIRVEERLALAIYRPKAFCTVTDIAF